MTSAIARVRNTLSRRLQHCIVGTLLTGIVMVVGCGSDTSAPNPANGTSGNAGHAGMAAALGGSSAGGSSAGGSAAGGNGGATTAGSAGSGGGLSSRGGGAGTTAGTGGAAGSSDDAGTGGAVICPTGGAAGANGSGLAPTGDEDGDGVPNCLDSCPLDAAKTTPGTCGCGEFEDDTDQDGVPDCKDLCPNDKLKSVPGVCGCEHSDTANADSDALVDCKDACPKDAALTEAGACGCLPASLGALCLAHRYKFDGTGTVAADSIAGTSGDATVVGAQLSGTGTVALLGATSAQYVRLPANLVSALGDSATFEAWVTWAGTGGDWQRIFDFGTSDAGAGLQGKAAGTVFLTPRAGGSGLRTAISPSDYTEENVAGIDTPLPTGVLTQLVVVVDAAGEKLILYRDGSVQGTGASIPPWVRLGLLNDANNWLGRSQYTGDDGFAGTLHEFRIYSRALTAAEISASFTAGPDTLPP